jgi:hypothetical protein
MHFFVPVGATIRKNSDLSLSDASRKVDNTTACGNAREYNLICFLSAQYHFKIAAGKCLLFFCDDISPFCGATSPATL